MDGNRKASVSGRRESHGVRGGREKESTKFLMIFFLFFFLDGCHAIHGGYGVRLDDGITFIRGWRKGAGCRGEM